MRSLGGRRGRFSGLYLLRYKRLGKTGCLSIHRRQKKCDLRLFHSREIMTDKGFQPVSDAGTRFEAGSFRVGRKPRLTVPWRFPSHSWATFAPAFRDHLNVNLEELLRSLWELKGTSISRSRTSSVSRFPAGKITRCAAYLKKYWYPTPRDRWRGALRNTFLGPSRAMAEWHHLDRLHRSGLSRLRPIAIGEERRRGVLYRALLITEAIEGSLPLVEWLSVQTDRDAALNAVGRWLAALHRNGFCHGALHPRNVVVAPGPDFCPIDPPKARWFVGDRRGSAPMRRELKMLLDDLQLEPNARENVLATYRCV